MLKRLGVVIPSTILTLLMAVGFSTPAFAYVDTTEVAEEPVQVVEETEPTEEERIPFTIHLITPTLRSASGQGERPRRKPRVPDAPRSGTLSHMKIYVNK